MAKQDKVLPARRQRDRQDDSVLIRSAESLGRVIGTLQRQLDGAAKRLKPGADGASAAMSIAGSDGDGGGSVAKQQTAPRVPMTTAADAVALDRPARTTGIKRVPQAKKVAAPSAARKRATKKTAAPRVTAAAAKTATRARAGASKTAKLTASTKSARPRAAARTKRQR